MQLAEWFRKTKVKQHVLAAAVGVTQGRISQLMQGVENPSIELAAKIEAATGGDVTLRDLAPPVTVQPLLGATAGAAE